MAGSIRSECNDLPGLRDSPVTVARKSTCRTEEPIYFHQGFCSLNGLCFPGLARFPQIDVKSHIGQHVRLIELGMLLHLGLKETGGNQKLMKIIFGPADTRSCLYRCFGSGCPTHL